MSAPNIALTGSLCEKPCTKSRQILLWFKGRNFHDLKLFPENSHHIDFWDSRGKLDKRYFHFMVETAKVKEILAEEKRKSQLLHLQAGWSLRAFPSQLKNLLLSHTHSLIQFDPARNDWTRVEPAALWVWQKCLFVEWGNNIRQQITWWCLSIKIIKISIDISPPNQKIENN